MERENQLLFKIITKELSQDDGEVFIDKNKTLGYLISTFSIRLR